MVAFAISQSEDVDVYEILFRANAAGNVTNVSVRGN